MMEITGNPLTDIVEPIAELQASFDTTTVFQIGGWSTGTRPKTLETRMKKNRVAKKGMCFFQFSPAAPWPMLRPTAS